MRYKFLSIALKIHISLIMRGKGIKGSASITYGELSRIETVTSARNILASSPRYLTCNPKVRNAARASGSFADIDVCRSDVRESIGGRVTFKLKQSEVTGEWRDREE